MMLMPMISKFVVVKPSLDFCPSLIDELKVGQQNHNQTYYPSTAVTSQHSN